MSHVAHLLDFKKIKSRNVRSDSFNLNGRVLHLCIQRVAQAHACALSIHPVLPANLLHSLHVYSPLTFHPENRAVDKKVR